MNLYKSLVASALLLALAPLSAAELQLRAAGPQDSVPGKLSAQALKRVPAETQALDFAWRLDADHKLQAVAEPYRAQSKEYWDTRSAAELAKGVAISTTAAGAVVRLSPVAGGNTKSIRASDVILLKDGRAYANGSGMESAADSDDLHKSGAVFSDGTTAFRIDPALGTGHFELKLAQADGDVVVHVFEPQSSVQLELKASRGSYLQGAPIRIDAALIDGSSARGVDLMRGAITSPGGQVREFQFVADKNGGYSAQLTADFEPESVDGLYEIHAFASAKLSEARVLRDARTAFAYTVPSARFTGAARDVPVRMREPVVYLQFDVEVAASGRYQIGGVLYGSTSDGEMVPVAMAQSARVLDAGVHAMDLVFGPDVLDGVKAGAPWQIRDLQLIDQGSMGLLEQRVFALEYSKQ